MLQHCCHKAERYNYVVIFARETVQLWKSQKIPSVMVTSCKGCIHRALLQQSTPVKPGTCMLWQQPQCRAGVCTGLVDNEKKFNKSIPAITVVLCCLQRKPKMTNTVTDVSTLYNVISLDDMNGGIVDNIYYIHGLLLLIHIFHLHTWSQYSQSYLLMLWLLLLVYELY